MKSLEFKQIKKMANGDHKVTFDIIVDTFEEAVSLKKEIEIELKNTLENQTTLR